MQTSVESPAPIGVAGQVADLYTDENGDIRPATNEEDTAEIPFGVMLAQGTGDDGVLLVAANTDMLVGIAVHGKYFDKPTQLGDIGLKPGVTFDKGAKGRFVVLTETAVGPHSEVHVRATDIDLTASPPRFAGGFRGTADSTKTIDITEFAKWRTSTDGAGLAVVEIDMTGSANAVADS